MILRRGVDGASLASLGGPPVRSAEWPTWPSYDATTEQTLLNVLRSQRWAISGPYRGRPCYERLFAAAFAQFHSVPFCTPVANGSAALAVTLRALEVGYGDSVVVPGLTWVACASSVTSVGGIPVPVDIDPETLAVSHEALERRLADGARAVILVHPFCTVADPERALAACRRYRVPLVEDCSQAHGATWNGRRVGTFGDAGVFSMQQSKVLTSGEGGAVITRSPAIAEKVEQLRADGRVFSRTSAVNMLELDEAGAVQGRNHCLSEFQAAVLLNRLGHLESENAIRRANAKALDEALATVPGVRALRQPPEVQPTYYNYIIRISRDAFAGRRVDDISAALCAELRLQIAPIYDPLHLHRLFNYSSDFVLRPLRAEIERRFREYANELPNCERARSECITVPHVALLGGEREISDIVTAIRKVQGLAKSLPIVERSDAAF